MHVTHIQTDRQTDHTHTHTYRHTRTRTHTRMHSFNRFFIFLAIYMSHNSVQITSDTSSEDKLFAQTSRNLTSHFICYVVIVLLFIYAVFYLFKFQQMKHSNGNYLAPILTAYFSISHKGFTFLKTP